MRVACIGFYGGLAREYNPGSFMIGWQTVRALRDRLGEKASIDLWSIDIGGEYDEPWTETQDGLTIRFFCRHKSQEVLEHIALHYDALVIGGDNVWSTRDPRSVFFAASDRLHASNIRLAFNCVSTLRAREEILPLRDVITRACARAAYVCVRAPHLHRILTAELGLSTVAHAPDPVLAVDSKALAGVPIPRLPDAQRPRLGIAVSPMMVNALIDVMRTMDELDAYDVCVYPFTRLYQQLESVLRIKAAFGDRFHYVERTLSPLEAYAFMGAFDVSLTDTFHGTIAAIVSGKPFIAFSHRDPIRSRTAALFETLGVRERPIPFRASEGRLDGWATNITPVVYDSPTAAAAIQPVPDRHRRDVAELREHLRAALANPSRADEKSLVDARARIEEHFSALARAIA